MKEIYFILTSILWTIAALYLVMEALGFTLDSLLTTNSKEKEELINKSWKYGLVSLIILGYEIAVNIIHYSF